MSQTATALPPLVKIVGTVEEIIPAPAPNRSGKIVLADGKRLGAFADKLQQVEEGRAYDFGCAKSIRDGVMYLDVKAIRAAAAPPPEEAARVSRQQTTAPTNGKKMDPQDYYKHKPTSPKDAERIFVAMGIKTDIETGRVGPSEDDYVERVNLWRAVWLRTFGSDDAAA